MDEVDAPSDLEYHSFEMKIDEQLQVTEILNKHEIFYWIDSDFAGIIRR